MYKDVMSMVKMILFSPEKLKFLRRENEFENVKMILFSSEKLKYLEMSLISYSSREFPKAILFMS